MLKCKHCGQYYVPGYLACQCLMKTSLPRPVTVPQLAKGQTTMTSAHSMVKAVPGADTQNFSDTKVAGSPSVDR